MKKQSIILSFNKIYSYLTQNQPVDIMAKKHFEILCISSVDNCVITNIDNLLNRLLGNGLLWKKAELKTAHIHDNKLQLKLTGEVLKHNPDTAKISIIVKVEGEENLDAFRLPLVKHLREEKFDHLYILTDDISKEMCGQLYPKINQVENLLRKYLTTFFATRLGPKWWGNIAVDDFNKKVRDRKNNETFFSKHIINGKDEHLVDTRSFLIDFRDLGEIIYRVSAGNLNSADITKQIEDLDEGDIETLAKAVVTLKNDVKTNIKKFFPEFGKIDFQSKWEFLYHVRNKVAHNSLISKTEFDEAMVYLTEIDTFLQKQNEELSNLQFDPEEVATYQQDIVKFSSKYAKITKSQLAWELYKMSDYTQRHNRPFIGLKYFVGDILGIKGFDIGASYDIINQLVDDKYIEIYPYVDITGQHTTQPNAIRILKPLNDLFENE